jgi:hypothetical protein
MPQLLFRVHAVQRMFEREISIHKASRALQANDVVEDYSSEMPAPSRLLIGFQGKRPFHLVALENVEEDSTTIITAYLPDPSKWKKDFRSRR